MKNTFGDSLAVTIFGESHGAAIGAVLDGLASGIPVDDDLIARRLSQRRPSGEISTARREADRFRIISGVYGGKTTGTPLCIEIETAIREVRITQKWKRWQDPGMPTIRRRCDTADIRIYAAEGISREE